jgi:hypothetical protein
MLLIVIPLIWLAVATFVLLLCRAAADADSVLLASTEPAGRRTTLSAKTLHPGARTTWQRPQAAQASQVAQHSSRTRVRA